MYKLSSKIKKLFCLFAVMAYSAIAWSQTTTINYLTSGLSSTACNVFSPGVTINTVPHSSLAGGVTFNSTHGIFLGSSNNTNSIAGTAYVISYNFNAGFNYDISITALGDNAIFLKTSVVSNLNAFATSSMSACPLDINVPKYNTIGYGQSTLQGNNNANKTYAIPQFYIPTSGPVPIYLVIWATGGDPSLSLDAFSISKIVITKSAPSPSFNITPSTVVLTCGTTSPVTFTANNPGGITGITNYTWNLGATPNGWKLPNGSAAPATYSTGNINTLTLTPVCGLLQKNISATVTANGTNYNTNTSTVSITQPVLSINGSSSFCTGSKSYLINNLPCNASVVWSISPATGVADLSCSSCTTTSLSQVGYGTVTLTAVVSNLCGGANVTLNTSVQIGSAPLTGTYSTATNTLSLQTVNFVPVGNIYAQYQWPGVSNITANLTSGAPPGTGFYSFPGHFSFNIASGQQVSVYIAGNSACGAVNATRTFIQSSYYYLVVSPNPASNNINVDIREMADTSGKIANEQKLVTSNTSGITKMYLYDFNTGILIKQWNFKEMKTSNYDLNIAGIKSGVYLLKMERNNKSTSTKIIVK